MRLTIVGRQPIARILRLDVIEKAIRSALEKGDADDRAFREKVYRSAFAALERALQGNPDLAPEIAAKRRSDLQAKIAEIETEFIPAVAPVRPAAVPSAASTRLRRSDLPRRDRPGAGRSSSTATARAPAAGCRPGTDRPGLGRARAEPSLDVPVRRPTRCALGAGRRHGARPAGPRAVLRRRLGFRRRSARRSTIAAPAGDEVSAAGRPQRRHRAAPPADRRDLSRRDAARASRRSASGGAISTGLIKLPQAARGQRHHPAARPRTKPSCRARRKRRPSPARPMPSATGSWSSARPIRPPSTRPATPRPT